MAVGVSILLQERTFAYALAVRLQEEPDVQVVTVLDTKALSPRLFAGSRVDVVLLDADIADDAAFRLCQELSQDSGAPYVIFISHSADPERIVRGIRAGAVGWVYQNESLDRLLHVIRGAATRQIWLPPGEAAAVLQLLARGPDPDRNHGAELLARPIGREREIVVRAEGAVHRRRRGNWSRARVLACACLPGRRMTGISTSPKRLMTSAIQAATR
jgi:DNA-binding NarL/FixJ family response regulator